MSGTTYTDDDFRLTTEEFAALNRLKAESIRRQIQRTGSYFGIEPMRLANGRLLFPAVKPKADRQWPVEAAR